MSDYSAHFSRKDLMEMHRWSHKRKMANNGKFYELMADHFRYSAGTLTTRRNKEKRKRLEMNYNLFAGRGQEAIKAYMNDNDSSYQIAQEAGVTAAFDSIPHHPVIDQIARTMVGEQQRRPLKAVAIDSSGYTNNMLKKKRLELYQKYIQESIINPIREQAFQAYMIQNGIEDPFTMTQEQQQQAEIEIDKAMKFKTPKEIEEFLRKDYRSPAETQAQRLTDFLMQDLDVKFITDEGFKHLIIAGYEIYYVGVRHNEPVLELVNPMRFESDSSNDSMFIEDGEWAIHETYLKYSDVINRYGHELTESQLKKLDNQTGWGPEGGKRTLDRIESELLGEISADPGSYTKGEIDIRSREGQIRMQGIYADAGHRVNIYDIKHTHIVFKTIRTLYYVEREDPQTGKTTGHWRDETYERQPGDVKVTKRFAPEVSQVVVLGSGEDVLYVQKGPLPYQYRSLDNPWDVKLPYVGVQFNKLMGNVVSTSPMDNAKPWQYKFNVQMQKIHEAEATDIGKVAMIALSAKPKDWDFEKWLAYAKYGRILPVDTKQEGFDPYDLQAIRELDLSAVQELAARIQYLEFLRQQMILSMSYNPARLGQAASTSAVSKNQQDIIQSSFQTEDIFYLHSKVQRNVLNALLNAARIAYKDNDFKRNYLLDDLSRAELELDTEMLWRSQIGIHIMNSSEEFNNIEHIKQLSHSMVQNGLITASDLIRIIWAKNGAEIFNIAENADEKAQKAREQAQQDQQRMIEQQQAMQQQMMEFEAQIKMLQQEKDIAKDIVIADINSDRFAKQWDIDQNALSDNIQMAREQAKVDLEMQKRDHMQEDKDRASKEKIEMAKIKASKNKPQK